MSRLVLYASVGAVLTQYDVDVTAATLTRGASIELPANVQYVWPHASRRFLYAATSNGASGNGAAGDRHHVSAMSVDPATGALALHGEPISLPSRPIHIATDIPSEHVLVAFNNPGAIRVYRINPDATPGEEVVQPNPIDPGIFPHQVRATPDNRQVILVSRGHDPEGDKPEEPGSLNVFDFEDGVLSDEVSVAPNSGYGFGPRHLDFHPSMPWVYVSLERENRLDMFELTNGALSLTPRFQVGTLANPDRRPGRQVVGTVHVHPNGQTVYVANRASDAVEHAGQKVFVGGENSLAVFALDPVSGALELLENVDTRGIHPRTFHIDPSGRLLVVAHIMGLKVRHESEIRDVPARLSLFHIAPDGRLEFARSYDIDVGENTMWWMGMVSLPGV
jgi:6-phosphogluconolactonase